MEYTTEVLNRATGELVERSLGEFVTVTELGQQYGKGIKETRVILHHMGLLRSEGVHGYYRLPLHAVAAGLGKRLKSKKSKYPFDSLSPKCQELIADAWDETVLDLQNEAARDPALLQAKADLHAFCTDRRRELTAQEGVSWLQYFHGNLTYRQMASILIVSEQLVGRYAATAADQRAYRKRMLSREMPAISLFERLGRTCSPACHDKLAVKGTARPVSTPKPPKAPSSSQQGPHGPPQARLS